MHSIRHKTRSRSWAVIDQQTYCWRFHHTNKLMTEHWKAGYRRVLFCVREPLARGFEHVSKHSLRFYHMPLVWTPPWSHSFILSTRILFSLTAWLPPLDICLARLTFLGFTLLRPPSSFFALFRRLDFNNFDITHTSCLPVLWCYFCCCCSLNEKNWICQSTPPTHKLQPGVVLHIPLCPLNPNIIFML